QNRPIDQTEIGRPRSLESRWLACLASGGPAPRPARRRQRLAAWAVMGRAADQAGDPRFLDGAATAPAGRALPAIHRVLRQEPPFQAQHGPIAGVEAGTLGVDRPGEHLRNLRAETRNLRGRE